MPNAIMVEQPNLRSYVSSSSDVVKIGQESQVLQFALLSIPMLD